MDHNDTAGIHLTYVLSLSLWLYIVSNIYIVFLSLHQKLPHLLLHVITEVFRN